MQVNPKGKKEGAFRGLRGGGWHGSRRNYRPSFRYLISSNIAFYSLSFRVVIRVSNASQS